MSVALLIFAAAAAAPGDSDSLAIKALHDFGACIVEESTLRAVPPPDASSPSTFQGSSAWRSSTVMPPAVTEPISGKRNSR